MTDNTRRQLEEASLAIEARVREIEANGGPAPQDMQSATQDHWGDIPDSVPVSYERYEDEPFDHGGCYQPHVRSGEYYDCDGRPI